MSPSSNRLPLGSDPTESIGLTEFVRLRHLAPKVSRDDCARPRRSPSRSQQCFLSPPKQSRLHRMNFGRRNQSNSRPTPRSYQSRHRNGFSKSNLQRLHPLLAVSQVEMSLQPRRLRRNMPDPSRDAASSLELPRLKSRARPARHRSTPCR